MRLGAPHRIAPVPRPNGIAWGGPGDMGAGCASVAAAAATRTAVGSRERQLPETIGRRLLARSLARLNHRNYGDDKLIASQANTPLHCCRRESIGLNTLARARLCFDTDRAARYSSAVAAEARVGRARAPVPASEQRARRAYKCAVCLSVARAAARARARAPTNALYSSGGHVAQLTAARRRRAQLQKSS